MKTTRLLLSLLLIVAITLSACGSGSTTIQATEQTTRALPDDKFTEEDLSGPFPDAELTIVYFDGSNEFTYTVRCSDNTAEITGDDVGLDARRACASLNERKTGWWLRSGALDCDSCNKTSDRPDTARITGTNGTEEVDQEIAVADTQSTCDWVTHLGELLPEPSAPSASASSTGC